jgi:hypothetical protein
VFVVSLTKDEVRVCTQLAVERWLMKFGSEDRPNYAKGKANGSLEHELLANIRTIVAEHAVAKALDLPHTVPWYLNELHPRRKEHGDVGHLEVRTVRTQDAVPMWVKDYGKVIVGAKVLDTEFYTKVAIYGWVQADNKVFDDDSLVDSYSNCWRVPLSSLTPFPFPEHYGSFISLGESE